MQAGVLGSGHSKGTWPEEEECVERMWREEQGEEQARRAQLYAKTCSPDIRQGPLKSSAGI